MRIFISAIACFLFSYVGAGSLADGSPGLAAAARVQAGTQCPPCIGRCVVNGFTFNAPSTIMFCDVPGCNGSLDAIFDYVVTGSGRDEIDVINNTPCKDGPTTCETFTTFEVQEGVCCPAGQTQPYLTCVQGNCVSVEACGVSSCTTSPNNCPPPCPLNQECPPGQARSDCSCTNGGASPVLIDVTGNGFHLTNQADGVYFDLANTGTPRLTAWTQPASGNAFLCLDRNGNGKIDNGLELFGNFTPQPAGPNRNGFLALAVYDLPENGGNGTGLSIVVTLFTPSCCCGRTRTTTGSPNHRSCTV
jgi:hypothetical protein